MFQQSFLKNCNKKSNFSIKSEGLRSGYFLYARNNSIPNNLNWILNLIYLFFSDQILLVRWFNPFLPLMVIQLVLVIDMLNSWLFYLMKIFLSTITSLFGNLSSKHRSSSEASSLFPWFNNKDSLSLFHSTYMNYCPTVWLTSFSYFILLFSKYITDQFKLVSQVSGQLSMNLLDGQPHTSLYPLLSFLSIFMDSSLTSSNNYTFQILNHERNLGLLFLSEMIWIFSFIKPKP